MELAKVIALSAKLRSTEKEPENGGEGENIW